MSDFGKAMFEILGSQNASYRAGYDAGYLAGVNAAKAIFDKHFPPRESGPNALSPEVATGGKS